MPVSKVRKKRTRRKTTIMAQNVEMVKDTKKSGAIISAQSTSFYQGVVPSPEMMMKYKEVDPSLPLRLVQLTEDEAIHRRGVEKKLTSHHFTLTIWNQVFAFLSVLVICLLSYLFLINGYADAGKYIVITVVVALAGLFLGKRIFVKKESPGK